ncbi:hypothetical protein EBB07_08820 [Paenibacillaceae bacterium]|nr:hypothetical protein EBB07_08820 [Paenibacillaceae bacterium]
MEEIKVAITHSCGHDSIFAAYSDDKGRLIRLSEEASKKMCLICQGAGFNTSLPSLKGSENNDVATSLPARSETVTKGEQVTSAILTVLFFAFKILWIIAKTMLKAVLAAASKR